MWNMKAVVALLILSTVSTFGQNNCVLKLEKDSIQVYTCELPDSKYKKIKTTFSLSASPEQLINMLLDIDHLGKWQYRTVSAQLLKKINDKEIIYYTEVSAPVIDNRDFIIHLKINRVANEREWTVTATSIPDFIPPKKNVVRIPMSRAIWKIKEDKPNKLTIEYVIEIDFGGILPAWVVNSLAHKAPYETFISMKEEITKYPASSY